MKRFAQTYTKESGKWQQIPGAFWGKASPAQQREGMARALWAARKVAARKGWMWGEIITRQTVEELTGAAWLEMAQQIEKAQAGQSWQRVAIVAACLVARREWREGLALKWTETASKAEAERLGLRGDGDRTVFDNAAYNNAELLPQPGKAVETSAMLDYLADGDELNRAILAGKAAGLGQVRLARELGITQGTISKRLSAMRERLEAWRLMDKGRI